MSKVIPLFKTVELANLESKSPVFTRPHDDDFADRMKRIKDSLTKINELLTQLKQTTKKPEYEE